MSYQLATQVWPVKTYRLQNKRDGFILAYGLVSFSGLCMGLLLGWAVWG
jgi:hypothetical protein